jgi:hypothetical protein
MERSRIRRDHVPSHVPPLCIHVRKFSPSIAHTDLIRSRLWAIHNVRHQLKTHAVPPQQSQTLPSWTLPSWSLRGCEQRTSAFSAAPPVLLPLDGKPRAYPIGKVCIVGKTHSPAARVREGMYIPHWTCFSENIYFPQPVPLPGRRRGTLVHLVSIS